MALLDTIEVYGIIVDAYGQPAADIECIFSVVCPPSCLNNIAITINQVSTTTDSTGGFSINLIQDAVYRVNIDDIGLIRRFTTPADGTSANLFELVSCSD